MNPNTSSRRFSVALTFAGEYRKKVERVAERLAQTHTRSRILYDHFHKAEFATLDLDVYLPNLYRTESDLIVVFLCSEYEKKHWCKLEWRAIRQLIASVDAERIMFLSFGDPGDLSTLGIYRGDGYIDISKYTPAKIVDEIEARRSRSPSPSGSTKTTVKVSSTGPNVKKTFSDMSKELFVAADSAETDEDWTPIQNWWIKWRTVLAPAVGYAGIVSPDEAKSLDDMVAQKPPNPRRVAIGKKSIKVNDTYGPAVAALKSRVDGLRVKYAP